MMIQLPPKQHEQSFKSQHSFTSVIRAEKYWIDQSRRNAAQFMNYMTGGERTPARHHLEWLYHIINPANKRVLIVASREFAKTHCAVYSMAWFIGNNPKLTNAIVSVAAKQAKERMEMLRDIMALPRYKNVFPWIHIDTSKPDTQVEFTVWSEKWNPNDEKTMAYQTYRSLLTTHYDSKMPTVKIAGLSSSELIGSRFSGLVLVDDPHDAKNSNTEDLRVKVANDFKTNVLNCMQESGKVVVIMTRWAETDLAAQLKETKTLKGKPVWSVVETPAIDKNGNSNWPEVWSLERLQAKREEVQELMFQTQYMNNPFGASSGMFDMSHLTNDIPEDFDISMIDKIVVSTDMASTKSAGADYTVIAAIAKDKRKPFRMYVLDMIRLKVNFDEGLQYIAKFCDDTFEKYHKLDGVLFEIPASRANAEELRNRRLDLPVIEIQIKGDKALRLGAVAVKAQGKNLFINQNIPCLQAVFSEMIGFPRAQHDDICDCLSLPLQMSTWSTGDGAGIKVIKSPFLL